jgi:hypothetical protein
MVSPASARRNRHGADGPPLGGGLVAAGFSTCAHAYVLSRAGMRRLLALRPECRAMPVLRGMPRGPDIH